MYDISQLKYWNEYLTATNGEIGVHKYHFEDEKTYTVPEKIAFIDAKKDGLATVILQAAMKYVEDLESGIIKTEKYFEWSEPSPKTISLKAWIKRQKKAFGSGKYPIGDCYSLGSIPIGYGEERWIHHLTTETQRIEFINATFHNILCKMAQDEKAYFDEHDEYTVLANKALNHPMLQTVTFPYVISSKEGLQIGQIGKLTGSEYLRKPTIEELEILIQKLDGIKAYADNVSAELQKIFRN